MSPRGQFVLLIFLASLKNSLSRQVDRDDWVCHIDGFERDKLQLARAFSKTGQFEAKFWFVKETAYPNNTVINSTGVIGVWVSLGETNGPLSFPIDTFEMLSNARRFLFDEATSTVGNVSCFLRHTSNGSKIENGLNALQSPLFYMKNISNISSQQYLSYIRIYYNNEETVYISLVSKNRDATPTEPLTFQQWHLSIFKISDHLIWIIISVYGPCILMLFCSTVNTNTPTAKLPSPIFESQTSDSTRESDVGRVATEHDFPKEPTGETDGSDASDLHTSDTNTSVKVSIETSDHPLSVPEGSKLVSRRFSSPMLVSDDQFRGEYSNQKHSGRGGTPNYTALSEHVPPRFINDTNITKVQPPKTVRAIDIGDTAYSVGFRSLIINTAFTKKKSIRFKVGKFVILLFVPLFVPVLVDVFVLLIPRCLSGLGSSENWSSPTISVFKFMYTKHPGFLVLFLFFFFRCFCLCFLQPSADCVPSFLCRKHVECFIVNSYIAKLLFPRRTSNACDECKATTDCPSKCEIPLNIKHNIGKQPIGILKNNYEYIFSHLRSKFRSWLFEGQDAPSSSYGRVRWKKTIIDWFGLFLLCVLFVILVALDMIVSSPVVALCYGRVWFAINYFDNRRFCLQLLCLALELVVIICSIIWTAYFSYCGSLSLEVALTTIILTFKQYPTETTLTIAINVLFWHILWDCYGSFTNKYDKLNLMLWNACSTNDAKDMEQYRREGTVQIPEDLLVCRRKLVPLSDSLIELIMALSWRGFLIVLLLIIVPSSTVPDSGVLVAIVTLLGCIQPRLLGRLFERPKKQELEDNKLEKRVEDHVKSYFQGKLD